MKTVTLTTAELRAIAVDAAQVALAAIQKNTPDDILSVDQVMKQMGLRGSSGRRIVQKAFNSGRIPGFRAGRMWFTHQTALALACATGWKPRSKSGTPQPEQVEGQ